MLVIPYKRLPYCGMRQLLVQHVAFIALTKNGTLLYRKKHPLGIPVTRPGCKNCSQTIVLSCRGFSRIVAAFPADTYFEVHF